MNAVVNDLILLKLSFIIQRGHLIIQRSYSTVTDK